MTSLSLSVLQFPNAILRFIAGQTILAWNLTLQFINLYAPSLSFITAKSTSVAVLGCFLFTGKPVIY